MYRAVKENDLKRLLKNLAEFSKSLLITLGETRKLEEAIAETAGFQRMLLPTELAGEAVFTGTALYFNLPGPAPSLNDLEKHLSVDWRVHASLRNWWY
ncbi:MAG: hypothetical protein ACPLRU_08335, partial [Desulfofundulus sp.]